MSAAELGKYAARFVAFRQMMAAVPPTSRLAVFENAVDEIAKYVGNGLDRVVAADELVEMASAHGLDDADAVQWIISRSFEKIRPEQPKPNGKHGPQPLQPLPSFDVGDFEGRDLPQRRWCVKDRIPMRNVTLLSGDGATGKTTIALQLAVRVATEQADWLGAVIDEPGPVLFLTAEEELDEMHYRINLIVERYGLGFSNAKTRMHLICMPGEDAVLASANLKTGLLMTTERYQRLRLNLESMRPKLVVLESSADLYGANESDRSLVRQFVGKLRALCLEFDCAVVLISHPSLTGLGSGTGTAGSTQWQNSVRSRMYFRREKKAKDEEDDNSDVRVLEVMKLNYAKQGETVRVKYEGGLFVMEQTLGNLEQASREQEIDRMFLILLDRFNREERYVGDKEGKNYAPAIFARETVAKAAKATSKKLADAMQRLFEAGKIRVVWEGPPSRKRSRIVRSPTPSNAMEGESAPQDTQHANADVF